MKITIFYFAIFLISASVACSQQDSFPILKGPYLGQRPPQRSPERFAPDIINDALHSVPVFSADGLEVYWVPWKTLKMKFMRQVNGFWVKPHIVSFALDYNAENPWLTTDGNRMYFTSTRPIDTMYSSGKKYWRENIWFVERKPDGWTDPVPLNREVNSMDLHWQFSIDDRNGDLYFSASSGENGGESDIYISKLANGEFGLPAKLCGSINTPGDEDTPFIASDGSYLIFARKPGKDTFSDLYVSFKDESGNWLKAVNLGTTINSKSHEVYPRVTKDGKYFFFISMKSGKPDAYWVDAKIITELNPLNPGFRDDINKSGGNTQKSSILE